MRDQYAGDVSDYIKFALLRALALTDRRLGVGWYYLPDNDGKPDGRHVEYLSEPGWSALDAVVHHALGRLPVRSVSALEGLPTWPIGVRFHSAPVPSTRRETWVSQMGAALEGADLVFLDPDDGIGPSGRKRARLSDLVALRQDGRALVTIKFPGRHATHKEQVTALHRDLLSVGLASPFTLCTCVRIPAGSGRVPRHRFFTIVDGNSELRDRARRFAETLSAIPNASAAIRCEESR